MQPQNHMPIFNNKMGDLWPYGIIHNNVLLFLMQVALCVKREKCWTHFIQE